MHKATIQVIPVKAPNIDNIVIIPLSSVCLFFAIKTGKNQIITIKTIKPITVNVRIESSIFLISQNSPQQSHRIPIFDLLKPQLCSVLECKAQFCYQI